MTTAASASMRRRPLASAPRATRLVRRCGGFGHRLDLLEDRVEPLAVGLALHELAGLRLLLEERLQLVGDDSLLQCVRKAVDGFLRRAFRCEPVVLDAEVEAEPELARGRDLR